MAVAISPPEQIPPLAFGKVSALPHDGRLASSIEEVAAILGISRTSAYLAAQRGELPSRMIGRGPVVPRAALQRFLSGEDAA
jgi:excisionase family DNA binding protein